MAVLYERISSYYVFQYSGPDLRATDATTPVATISLFLGEMTSPHAFLNFFGDVGTLRANEKITYSSGAPTNYYVSFRWPQLTSILDVLRNEGPLYFYFNDGEGRAYVTTAKEPVGEGES